jgi:hypothetical protein
LSVRDRIIFKDRAQAQAQTLMDLMTEILAKAAALQAMRIQSSLGTFKAAEFLHKHGFCLEAALGILAGSEKVMKRYWTFVAKGMDY